MMIQSNMKQTKPKKKKEICAIDSQDKKNEVLHRKTRQLVKQKRSYDGNNKGDVY